MHVSGHASAGELVYCYNIVQPSQRHARARRVAAPDGQRRARRSAPAYPPRTSCIAEDGVVVDLVDGRAKITGKVPAGLVYVDGMTVGGATEASLKDRRTLAEEGVITIVALVDADTGKLAEPPDFLARGFVHDEQDVRRRRPADREGAGQGRAGGHRRAAPARAAHPPDRQPLGARHLPAQPDHHADHHRRLSSGSNAAVSAAHHVHPRHPPAFIDVEVGALLDGEHPIGVSHPEAVVNALPVNHASSLHVVHTFDHVCRFEPLVEHLLDDIVRRASLPETCPASCRGNPRSPQTILSACRCPWRPTQRQSAVLHPSVVTTLCLGNGEASLRVQSWTVSRSCRA